MNILTQFDPCMLMLSHYMQHVSYVRSPGKMLARSECDMRAFWRQPWRREAVSDVASGFHSSDLSMPCLASFFGAMAGVGKLVCPAQGG